MISFKIVFIIFVFYVNYYFSMKNKFKKMVIKKIIIYIYIIQKFEKGIQIREKFFFNIGKQVSIALPFYFDNCLCCKIGLHLAKYEKEMWIRNAIN